MSWTCTTLFSCLLLLSHTGEKLSVFKGSIYLIFQHQPKKKKKCVQETPSKSKPKTHQRQREKGRVGKEEDGDSSRLQTEPKNPQNIFTLLKSLTVQYTWLWFSYTHARAQNTHTHTHIRKHTYFTHTQAGTPLGATDKHMHSHRPV